MPCKAKLLTLSGRLLVGLLLAATGALTADEIRAPGAVTLHTVVPTECTMYFSWQSLGIFYSHKKAGQTGPITRIISCTEEQQHTYKVGMQRAPSTFTAMAPGIHCSMTGYPAIPDINTAAGQNCV